MFKPAHRVFSKIILGKVVTLAKEVVQPAVTQLIASSVIQLWLFGINLAVLHTVHLKENIMAPLVVLISA